MNNVRYQIVCIRARVAFLPQGGVPTCGQSASRCRPKRVLELERGEGFESGRSSNRLNLKHNIFLGRAWTLPFFTIALIHSIAASHVVIYSVFEGSERLSRKRNGRATAINDDATDEHIRTAKEMRRKMQRSSGDRNSFECHIVHAAPCDTKIRVK